MSTTIFEINDFYRRRIELAIKLEMLREDDIGISERILTNNKQLLAMLGDDYMDEDGILCVRKKGDGFRFFQRIIGRGGKVKEPYLSLDSPTLSRLAAKSIIKKLRFDVENEIEFLNRRLNIINKQYPRFSKSQLSTTVMRLNTAAPGLEQDILSTLMQFTSPQHYERMADVMRFCRMNSEKSDSYSADRDKETKAGYWVRSKEEKEIADTLYDQSIPFLFEPLMVFDGTELHPDFVLIRPDGSLVIWEHRGLTTPSYIEDGYKRLRILNRAGYYMNNNLIYTYPQDLKRKSTLLKIIMRFYYVW